MARTIPDARSTCPIAIFARAPVPGSAKTRLIPRLGAKGAADLHALLVLHMIAQARAAALGPVTLWCSPDADHAFFEDCAARFGVDCVSQIGADLGERMFNAFRASDGKLLLVGSDCPVIGPALLTEAAASLDARTDAVFCPAEDGGYGLVGLRSPRREIFDGVTWGSSSVMEETRGRMRRAGMSWHETATVWDVDRPEDVERLVTISLTEPTLKA